MDKVTEMMSERKITLYRNNLIKCLIVNKVIIDYATEYTSDKKTLYNINVMRRHKGVFLPVELVGPYRKTTIDCYVNEDKESLLLWYNKERQE